METKKFYKVEDLEKGDVIRAILPSIEYVGSLYVTGYEPNPSRTNDTGDIRFFGIRNGEEEIYYINPKKLAIISNTLIQKPKFSTFRSEGVTIEKIISGEITTKRASKILEEIDVEIFPADISNAQIYKDASKTLRSVIQN